MRHGLRFKQFSLELAQDIIDLPDCWIYPIGLSLCPENPFLFLFGQILLGFEFRDHGPDAISKDEIVSLLFQLIDTSSLSAD